MIIDDSVTFFGVYFYNCTLNLNTIKALQKIMDNYKYNNLILCQKDQFGGYLLTHNVFNDKKMRDVQSHYFKTKDSLKQSYKDMVNKFSNIEKTFYLICSEYNDINETEGLLSKWREGIQEACNI